MTDASNHRKTRWGVLWNLLGRGLPLVLAVFTIPLTIVLLGADAFGILSLAWVILNGFIMFDMGLGRASTRYVAEALARADRVGASRAVWSATTFQCTIGGIAGAALFLSAPTLVHRFLNVPAALQSEALATFQTISFAVPLVVAATSLKGGLEGSLNFGLVNVIQGPASAGNFVLPFAGALLGWNLPEIAQGLVVIQLISTSAFLLLVLHKLGRPRSLLSGPELRRLVSFGGWITLSQFANVFLVHADRIMLGALTSLSAVAYYTAPYEIVVRLRIISVAVATAAFPTLSSLTSRSGPQATAYTAMTIKLIVLLMTPVVLITAIFSYEILSLWIGQDFARQGSIVLSVLSIGVLANGIAGIPVAYLHAQGRADVTAKAHLFELPFYLMAAFALIAEFGIVGAALAWTLRAAVDATLMFTLARQATMPSDRRGWRKSFIVVSSTIAIVAGVALSASNIASIAPKAVFAAVVLIGATSIYFQMVLSQEERRYVWNFACRRGWSSIKDES